MARLWAGLVCFFQLPKRLTSIKAIISWAAWVARVQRNYRKRHMLRHQMQCVLLKIHPLYCLVGIIGKWLTAGRHCATTIWEIGWSLEEFQFLCSLQPQAFTELVLMDVHCGHRKFTLSSCVRKIVLAFAVFYSWFKFRCDLGLIIS